MKKLFISTFLLIIVFICLFLYGCCSSSGNNFFVNPQGESVEVTYRETVIDEQGRLPTVTFPSGAIIEGKNENTLQPGIKVTISESRYKSEGSSYFSEQNSTAPYVYMYRITAVLEPSDLLKDKTYVTTFNKPFSVTLPVLQKNKGLCYIGVRNSDTEPWRFFRADDGNASTANIMSLKVSDCIAAKECTFNLYRLGITFAIVVYDSNSVKQLETAVDGFVASSSGSILVKDGKYLENLEIKGIFKGVNLDALKESDLRVRVTYRNSQQNVDSIKVNGSEVVQETFIDKTVPGFNHYHRFEIADITNSTIMNTDGQFPLSLNIKGIGTKSFPSEFLIEFYNRIDSEKILPFYYAELFSVKETESVSFKLVSDDGNLIDETNNLYKCNPSFTITPGFEFSEADRAKIADAVKVSEVSSMNVVKTWNNNVLSLSFRQNLEPDTSYTISMSELSGIDGVSVNSFTPFTFRTIGGINISLAPNAGSVFDEANSLYKCNPSFTITPSFDFSESDRTKIADAIKVTNVDNSAMTKSWNNNVLSLSFRQNLEPDTSYTISMSELSGIDGVSLNSFAPFTFRTIGGINISLTSNEGNIFDEANSLYKCNPSFTITPSFDFSESDRTKIADAVKVSEIASTNIVKTWNNNVLSLSFRQNLEPDTSYTISMSEITDIEGVEISPFAPFTFKTIGIINVDLTPANDNIIDPQNNLYHCRPEFIISPGFSFNENDKAKIYNAISVSNVDNNMIVKTWNNDKLTLSFNQNLNKNTSYTLSMSDINDIDGVTLQNFSDFTFETIGDISVALSSADTNVIENGLYYCKPSFTITPGFEFNDSDKAKIAESISINGVNNDLISTSWNGNNLTVTFNDYIEASSACSISIQSDCGIKGIQLTPFDTFNYTTFIYKGRGTTDEPYLVENSYQLDKIRNYVTCNFKQTQNIDLSNFGNWNPIGTYDNGGLLDGEDMLIGCLEGIYDGNNKKIIGLTINNFDDAVVALFIGIKSTGAINNLSLENISVTGNGAAGLAIINYGTIKNCSVTGNSFINGSGNLTSFLNGFAGGLLYANAGILESCFVKNATITSSGYYGGLLFLTVGGSSIKSCYVEDSTISGGLSTGGFVAMVGDNLGADNITECYVKNCNVNSTGVSGGFAGGIGKYSNLANCYVVDTTVEGNQGVGGFAGSNFGTVTKSFVDNTIVKGNDNIAGFIATSKLYSSSPGGIISSCYVKNSSIIANNDFDDYNYNIGGFVAYNYNVIKNCYVSNNTVTGKTNYGAIVGILDYSGTMVDCFDTDNYSQIIGEDLTVYGDGSSNCCYYNIDSLEKFNNQVWSGNTWTDFNLNGTTWPPSLVPGN